MTDVREQSKPWWQSRTIIGALVTVAASLAALLGWTLDIEQTVELAMMAATLAGGVLAWWGRLRAVRPISRTQVLPGLTLGQGE